MSLFRVCDLCNSGMVLDEPNEVLPGWKKNDFDQDVCEDCVLAEENTDQKDLLKMVAEAVNAKPKVS